jgi:hypothetical protein
MVLDIVLGFAAAIGGGLWFSASGSSARTLLSLGSDGPQAADDESGRLGWHAAWRVA